MSAGRTRIALWLRLARRFMRTKPMRRSAAIVLVPTALLMALFVTLQGFSQSGEQVVEQDLGRFDSLIDLGGPSALGAGDTAKAREALAALERAGPSDSMLLLQSFDVEPALADASFTVFFEADWASEPFPERYSLIAGSWPDAPGEVVVTPSLAEVTRGAKTVPVLAGNEQLRVVGRVSDRFGTESSKLLAAPGTWRSFDARRLATKYPDIEASPALLWSGAAPGRVRRELGDLSGPLRTRATELSKDRRGWLDRIPIAYQVPSVLLPLLAVIAGFGINGRRLRRNLGTLRSVGVGARDAIAAVMLAGSAWFSLAALAGVAAGAGLGLAARPVWQLVLTRPLSPFPDVGGPALRLVAVVILGCLGVAAATAARQRRSTARSLLSALPRGRSVSHVRHALATAAAVVAIWQVIGLDSVTGAMALTGTVAVLVALMTPELVHTLLRRLPADGPRRRLARQQLLFDDGRVLVTVALLTASLGPALGLVVLLDTLSTSEAKRQISEVPPGQVRLGGEGGAPPRDLVERVVREVDPPAPPIRVFDVGSDAVDVGLEGIEFGYVIAVDTVEDAFRLSNDRLTARQRRTLGRGGLLAWERDDGPRRLLRIDVDTGAVQAKTRPIPVAEGPPEPSWQESEGIVGLMLTPAARRLELPLSLSQIALTGLTGPMSDKAEQVARQARYDPAFVDVYSVPDPDEVPPAFWGAVAGLGILVLLTVFTVARAHATVLRRYLGGLIAIGLPPRWARDVLSLQGAVVIAISTLLGLVIAIAPVVATAIQIQNISLSVPWLSLGAVVGLFVGSAWLATVLSSSKLRASDRRGLPG